MIRTLSALINRPVFSNLTAALVVALAAACSKGEEREYLGPADPNPIDRNVARVIVTPTIGTMQLDEGIDFSAFARNNVGDSMGVEVTWTATGGDVSAAGQFTSSTPGAFWVVARSVKQPDKADSAQVMVAGSSDPIERLEVTPKALGMKVGQTRQFEAAAYYGDGTQAQVPVFWSASGGSIDANGLYTPDEPGDQVVLAVVGNGLIDTAHVQVRNTAVLTGIDITPSDDSVDQGGELQYLVDATWSDGSTGSPAVDFSTSGGVVDSSGLFIAAAPPGDYEVTARDRDGLAISTARVRVRGDRPATFVLTPPSVALATGASHRFSATAKTASGRTVNAAINWQATGGTITASGNYTAGGVPGTYRVVGTISGGSLADTSVVIVSAPTATLTGLTVTPGSATVAAGDHAQFSVTGTWSDGSTVAPSVTWSATGGTITSIGDYTGGIVPGNYRVIARHSGGKADTSAVTVTAARITSLSIAPSPTNLTAGGAQQFTAAATWSDGSAATPTLVWTATGGSVNATGRYTAGTAPGTFRVIGRDAAATVADTAFVTITSPTPVLTAIDVNPSPVTLAPFERQQFYANGVWTNGGSALPVVTWLASAGNITTAGMFTAPETPGTYRVIARQQSGTLADTVVVTVDPAPATLIGVDLSPSGATAQPGGSIQYAVQGIWTSGGSGAPAVKYSATGGTITATGLFTAGATGGTYRVIATQVGGTLADTVAVTVSSATPVLTGISVTPGISTVPINGGQQFTAQGLWTNGGSGTPSVTWTATGGSVNGTGYYTAGGATGTYRVIATQVGGSFADTAVVTVSSSAVVLTSLRILPDSVNIQKGMTVEFQLAGQWSDGSTTKPQVIWAASGGGTMYSSGRFVAGTTAGVYSIIARHQGGTLADTAQVRVLSPTVTSINLTPGSASMPTGTTQQFSASAMWSDGVVRPVAVTYRGTGGTVSTSGLYTAGQVAGAFAVIASCSCGKSDTSGVVITNPSGGNATLVSMSLNPSSVTLAPSGTQQFNVNGQWSNGGSSAPSVTYSATGGTISASGYFTAPAATGTVRVIASYTGGNLADTATVTVQPGSPSSPWFEEDFSGYNSTAALLAYPSTKWSGASEDVNISKISLDPGGPPVGGKSMRYTFPDRTADPNLCHDYTIGRNLKFPSGQQEVWVEMWVKIDQGFETYAPSCTGVSANGYKFIFGRCNGSGCGRFEIKIGNEGSRHQTVYAPGLKNIAPSQVIPISSNALPYSEVADGQWHRWRQHMKVGSNGRYRMWFDNRLIYDSETDARQVHPSAITANEIYGLALGRNMNQGPIQVQSLYWGRVRVWRTDQGW